MKFPHCNRLTGLRWWRHLRPRDDSEIARLRTEAKISELLLSPHPCAMGKVGTTELMGMEYHYRWFQPPWPPPASWHRPASRLHHTAGLFPVRKDIFWGWTQVYRNALQSMDFLAQWQPPDTYLSVVEDCLLHELAPGAFRGSIHYLRYWQQPSSWLKDLASFKWLIIHPFENTIRSQLPKMGLLGIFPSESAALLKERALNTRLVACPQLSYMVPPRHRTWLHALDDLRQAMEREEFDVALVGAGAWSLPLVAHAKKLGKKGMHMGGSLQLLFGIKGGRWDQKGFYNEHWVRPLASEVPANHRLMEQGAYW